MLKSPQSIQGVSAGGDRFELSKELGPELRSGGSINVGEEKGKAGDSRGKMNRQSMCGAARTDKGERRIRPSSQDSPRSTIGRIKTEAI